MNLSTLSITISIIVAFAAIISPIITTCLNNSHQLKLKKMEYKQIDYERTFLRKQTIFENYIQSLSQFSQLSSSKNIEKYSYWYPLAYMNMPEHIRKTMAEINLLISKKRYDEAIKYIDLLSMDIYRELKQNQ